MKIIKINLDKIKKEEINLIIDYLKRGKVIVYPTDTIYGLGCMATNREAINKIYKIKKRNKKKPLIILVSSLIMLKKYCFVSKKQDEYLRKIWPSSAKVSDGKPGRKNKPITVILKSREILPKELTSGSKDIAVRLPKSELLIKIIRQVNNPIVSTSVNISGKRSLANISQVDKYFGKFPLPPFNKGGILPDLVINVGKIDGKSSKLVDLRDLNNIKVLRK